ncbi:hypothetical protein PHMEG_00033507, partial [Phytophthora megakarya]
RLMGAVSVARAAAKVKVRHVMKLVGSLNSKILCNKAVFICLNRSKSTPPNICISCQIF